MTATRTPEPQTSTIRKEDLQPFCYHAIPEEEPFCLRPHLTRPMRMTDGEGNPWTCASDGRVIAFAPGHLRWVDREAGELLGDVRGYLSMAVGTLTDQTTVAHATPDLPPAEYKVWEAGIDETDETVEVTKTIPFLGQKVSGSYLRKIERCAGPVLWWIGPAMENQIRERYLIWRGEHLFGVLCPLRSVS
mgnify:CR=1 FL=1